MGRRDSMPSLDQEKRTLKPKSSLELISEYFASYNGSPKVLLLVWNGSHLRLIAELGDE